MRQLDRFIAWWKDWDAGPLLRLVLWSAIAAALAWRRWHVTPVDVLVSILKGGVVALLVSCTLFQVLALIFCAVVQTYLFLDDLLYGASERLVGALWSPSPRPALLFSAILVEFALAAALGALLAALGGRLL